LAINDFVPVATAPGSNVIAQGSWVNDPARLGGFTIGLLQSAKSNKAWRQSTFVASGVAQMIVGQLNQDVLDNGDLGHFTAQLEAAIQSLGGAGPGGGTVSEAPLDGQTYGRNTRVWLTVPTLAGGTFTGPVLLHGDPVQNLEATPRQYVDRVAVTAGNAVQRAGDTMTGGLVIGTPPPGNLGAGTLNVSGMLQVNANTAIPPPPVSGRTTMLHIAAADATSPNILFDGWDQYGSTFTFRQALGTAAAPGPTVVNNALGAIEFFGRGATVYGTNPAAKITVGATENWSDMAHGTSLQFATTANGSTAMVNTMTLAGNGALTLAVPLSVANGGTGATTFVPSAGNAATARCLLVGNGTNPVVGSSWGSYGDWVSLACYGAPNSAYIDMGGTTGTTAAPTATPSGHPLAWITFNGYGTAWANGAYIQANATELWNATAHGTNLQWWTTANTTTAPVNTMQLGNTFGLSVNLSPAPILPLFAADGSWSKGLCIQGGAGVTATVILDADTGSQAVFCGRTYRGTSTARSALLANDTLAVFGGTGHNGTSPTTGSWPLGSIGFYAAENWTATANGTYAIISTITPGTTGSGGERMRIGQGVMIGTTADPGAGVLAVAGQVHAAYLHVTTGDIMFDRTDQAAAYLLRPNTTGFKTLNLAVAGGQLLDSIGLYALNTTVSGPILVACPAGTTGQVRMAPAATNTGYGVILRNDSSYTYIMLTANNDAFGTWNGLRPFTVDNVLGNVAFAHSVMVGAPSGGQGGTGTLNAVALYSNGTLVTSDLRTKRDIDLLPDDCLSLVAAIKPKTFRRIPAEPVRYPIDRGDDPPRELGPPGFFERRNWGFVAQDVAEIMRAAGHDFGGHVENDDGLQSLSYNDLIAVLWKAVQELRDKVEQSHG
jgi:hypothetical protein